MLAVGENDGIADHTILDVPASTNIISATVH